MKTRKQEIRKVAKNLNVKELMQVRGGAAPTVKDGIER
jgi:hypothetical protein